ncbi:MAG: hypothetical protein ACK56I_30195, partial [bacterium]
MKGIGTAMFKFKAKSGKICYLPMISYHIETVDIRLFSPQCYFKSFGGHAHLTKKNISLHLSNGEIIEVPYDFNTNLP